MFVRNRLFAAFSLLFLSGCAAITAPEGGPRDEKKPLLVSTHPANGTTNFKDQTLRLEFDEPIRVKDLNKELIITPNTGNAYTTQTDREKLILEFTKPLEENTTFFLNFRNGVEDVTEGNKAPNVALSFSTGNSLDTAQINGVVTDYITNTPENDFTVALYPENDTATIRKNKPYYFTRTNSDGSFTLQNLKAGTYWIFAHQDKNSNEIYDQEAEKIAYFPTAIQVNPRLDSVMLKTVRIDTGKPYVLTTENHADLNTLVYNEGITKISFRNSEKKDQPLTLLNLAETSGKRVFVYPINGQLPASAIAISIDSAGNQGIDTVKFNLANKPAIQGTISFKTNKTELVTGTQNQIKFTYPTPIQITGSQPILIKEDTLKKVTYLTSKDYSLNETKNELTINYSPNAQKTVTLIIDSTQVAAVNGKPVKKQSQQFTLTKRANSGSISGTVKTNFTNYTVELLDEKNAVVNQSQNPKKINYQDLTPGNYTIRVKIDENNDGKWSVGDRKLKTPPEKLYKYPQPITVRANWEIEDIYLVF